MNIKKIGELFIENWQLLLPAAIVLISTVWGVAYLYFAGRVENLREQINLLNTKNSFLEYKIRSIEDIQVQNIANPKNASELAKKISSLKYPSISDPQQLSKSDIRKLADFYDLTKSWKTNPHLKIKEGDISYWYKQGLTENEIRLEFETRRIALEEAEKNNQTIDTQGDLSNIAQKIQARLIKKQ